MSVSNPYLTRLKPFRQYAEQDVINLFALNASSGDRGSFVTIQGSGFVNGKQLGYVNLTNLPNVVSQRPYVLAQVGLSASGQGKSTVLGMMLYDVREVNFLGLSLLFDPIRREEAQCSISGQAVPIVTRGLFLVYVGDASGSASGTGPSTFVPTVGPGSGAMVADGGNGGWKIIPASDAKSLGNFLGNADADGYALFHLKA